MEKGGSLPLPLAGMRLDDDCVNLKKGGPSGLVVALIELKWWACTGERHQRWLAAVADVKGCLEAFTPASRKRKAEGSGHCGKGKKKKV